MNKTKGAEGMTVRRRILGLLTAVALLLTAGGCGDGGQRDASSSPVPTAADPFPVASLPSAAPSTGQGSRPVEGDGPEKTLECLVDCLRKGDIETLCTLFENSDPQMVYRHVPYAFHGPLELDGVIVEANTQRTDPNLPPMAAGLRYMHLFFWVRHADSSVWGIGGDVEYQRYPQLRRSGGVWKIVSMGTTSPY